VRRNGHAAGGPATNGHESNGHAKNGHLKNGHLKNGHLKNGHARNGHAKNGHAGNGEAKNGHVEIPAPPSPPALEVRVSRSHDLVHVARISALLAEAQRGGAIISVRSESYLETAIRERRAVVVVQGDHLVGFAAAHAWEGGRYVSHSALVVAPEMRGRGLSRDIKLLLIELSRKRWPNASIISLTLSHHVERMNQSFGFETVPYCDLTKDAEFWKGCDGCIHQPHLKRNQQQDCHCWSGLLPPVGLKREKVVPRDAHGHPSASSGDY
jgi:N-acetylglutamate synthase-like GNAT family acetyltransferase